MLLPGVPRAHHIIWLSVITYILCVLHNFNVKLLRWQTMLQQWWKWMLYGIKTTRLHPPLGMTIIASIHNVFNELRFQSLVVYGSSGSSPLYHLFNGSLKGCWYARGSNGVMNVNDHVVNFDCVMSLRCWCSFGLFWQINMFTWSIKSVSFFKNR